MRIMNGLGLFFHYCCYILLVLICLSVCHALLLQLDQKLKTQFTDNFLWKQCAWITQNIEEEHIHVIRIIQKCQKISEHLPRHVWV